jgi:hypothetical protein
MALFRALQLKTASAIWQRVVKDPKRLAGLLVRAVPLIVGAQSRSWVKAVFVFARLVARMHQRQGARGTALFLKANNLILMRLLAGQKLGNPREAGVAVAVTRRGIPRWIPRVHRKRLILGDVSTIRFYLGLMTLYRVIDFKGKLKLDTIVKAGVQIDPGLITSFSAFAHGALLDWWGQFGVKPVMPVREREDSEYWGQPEGSAWYLRTQRIYMSLGSMYKWIFTSGPNSKFSKSLAVGNVWLDLLAVISRPGLLTCLNELRAVVGDGPLSDLPFFGDATKALDAWDTTCAQARKVDRATYIERKGSMTGRNPQFDVGALSVVEEPGKKRIVAMVDIWTQWMFYPLHRALFKRLRQTPNDGTFDQTKPVNKLLERAKKDGRTHFWSFDLSAATDRLPLTLQVELLSAFVCAKYAALWGQALVDRDYRVPKEFATTYGRKAPEGMRGHVRYAVGQPMGAYSSWAMLAMVHHAIIQFAAWRLGHRAWFTWYAVLGDDVVIADKGVADEYVRLMKEFGVEIGFHKSIISNNSSLEFAKRFYFKGEEVNPLSLQGIAVGWLGPGFLPEVLASCESRVKRIVSGFQIAKYLGVGFRAGSGAESRPLWRLPRILRSAFILLLRPGAPRGQPDLASWIRASSLMGSLSGKVKNSEGLVDSVWKQIVDGQLEPAIKRVRSVAKKLVLREQCLGEKFTSGIRVWFKSVVQKKLASSALQALDQAGDELRVAKKAWSQGSSLAKVLARLNQAEATIQLIPEEFLITRRELESKSPSIQRVLLSKSVVRWTRSRPFVRAKPSGQHRVRTSFAPKVDLSRER